LENKRIKITIGTYWVEMPAAKVYVLCGCLADSAKYLIIFQKRSIAILAKKAIMVSSILLSYGKRDKIKPIWQCQKII